MVVAANASSLFKLLTGHLGVVQAAAEEEESFRQSARESGLDVASAAASALLPGQMIHIEDTQYNLTGGASRLWRARGIASI